MLKLLLLLFMISCVWADPAPLGLEIGKATIKEAKERYRLTYLGINKYTQGEMYKVDVSELDMKYIRECTLLFDKNGKLVAVVMSFSKSGSGRRTPEFEYYYKLLREKYSLVESRIPFVGDTYARFVDGGTEILLEAPHLSFTMTLTYIKKDVLKSIKEQMQKESMEERQKSKQKL
ncbi:MAG: hypothetical protein ACK4VK_05450 [Aquificaceae bacterium]